MHYNKVFSFKKNIFDNSTSKRHENIKKNLILNKKNLKFKGTRPKQTLVYVNDHKCDNFYFSIYFLKLFF